jgi:hypothetical protein
VSYFPIVIFIDDQGPESIAGDNVQRNVKEWLSPPDPWQNHYVARRTRHDGTGTWLIQGDTYARWKYSGSSSLLWINGKRPYFVFICLSEADDYCIYSRCGKERHLVR